MAKGQPDFGQYAPTETIVGLSDMGELAARLGSIVTFDRRGNIVRLYNFEGGIAQWELGGVGPGRTLEWVQEYHRSGNFCAKLTTRDAPGWIATMETSVSYPILSKIGIEYSVMIEPTLKYINLLIDLYNGSYVIEANAKWTQSTALWQLTHTGGGVSLSPTMKLSPAASVFNTIKLVADFNNNQYCRLLANNVSYDLSAYYLVKGASTVAPRIDIAIQIETNTTEATHAYVDDFIQTQNEP